MKIRANAKLNLSLDIVGVRDDGYHLLDMVLQSITLSDILTITTTDNAQIVIESNSSDIPTKEQSSQNLVYQAALLLADFCGLKDPGLHIYIEKHIPTEAGLGGGSADAAATLIALRQLYNLSISDQELAEIGLSLGADIPFCLKGGTANVSGIGEIVSPLNPLTDCHFIVVMPPAGISTAVAYQLIDRKHSYKKPNTEQLISAVELSDVSSVADNLQNVFESSGVVMLPQHPVEFMKSHRADGISLTGSGTAFFGMFCDETAAVYCYEEMKLNYMCWLCKPTDSGTEFIQ
ncbi:MAG: 4-(cytidine 5'-diphospho)-2-C-methyl-D-erythritol kinase [Oscillospiraceae bacterium]|nr:4-(cytidine 5'-diphospho)-2-C-methyl-D-erythritol kinase [Oscillospiraceae bacterium]